MPSQAAAHDFPAWLLATCPDPKFRDAPRAVTLAQRAVELAPDDGHCWNTLGVAHYRAGDWKAAVDALTKSEELGPGPPLGHIGFFLTMAYWQLGKKDKAHQWYDKAVARMEKYRPQDVDLGRFRAEAEELLGIQRPPPAPEKPATKP